MTVDLGLIACHYLSLPTEYYTFLSFHYIFLTCWAKAPSRDINSLDFAHTPQDDFVENLIFNKELESSDHKVLYLTLNKKDMATGSLHLRKLNFWKCTLFSR